MANYTDSTKLYQMFGQDNVTKWANLDNGDPTNAGVIATIAGRITWACEIATSYVDGRLITGKYTVPFATVPKMIEYLATMLAGLCLYDGRSIVSESSRRDELSFIRKKSSQVIRQILNGQLRLTDPLTGVLLGTGSYNVPAVLQLTDSKCISTACYEYIHEYGCTCYSCASKSIILPSLP